jgi:hypothetical protein
MFPTHSIDNLKEKFFPHLIGHEKCPIEDTKKQQIEEIFRDFDIQNHQFLENKNYIIDAGNWILKRARPKLGHNTHLYRVRKAEKVRKYIQKNHLQDHFTVPEMWLYNHNGTFFVVCEKLRLSNDIARLSATWLKESLLDDPQSFQNFTQIQALRNNAPERDLTPIQAHTLAELAFKAHLTDLSFGNLFFTPDHKVALIDFEPIKRTIKKEKLQGFDPLLHNIRSHLSLLQSLTGTAKLKTYTSCNNGAMQQIESVERKYICWHLATRVLRLTAAIFTLVTSITLLSYFNSASLALTLAAYTISYGTNFLSFRVSVGVFLQIYETWQFWNLVSNLTERSLTQIVLLENNGLI